MNPNTIDITVFNDLKDAAGADFVVELVGTFLEEAPLLLAELRQACAQGQAERFKRAAHSLKTNAQTFGAMALGEQARALEMSGLPAGNVADQALDALDTAYAQAASALQAMCRA